MSQKPNSLISLKYFRTGERLPSIGQQRELLQNIPALSEWHDPPPRKRYPELIERDRMLMGVHAGDEIWVASYCIWGINEETFLSGLELLTKYGGVLRILGDEEKYKFSPEMEKSLKLLRMFKKDNRERAALPMLAGQERRRNAGLNKEELKNNWEMACKMWPDLRYSVEEISQKAKISSSTLYRKQADGLLPVRNAAPFVGGPNKIRKRGIK